MCTGRQSAWLWRSHLTNNGNQVHPASVIIPTWNGKGYIADCLNSLLAQDYRDFEVIVVDNASSDDTPPHVAEDFPTVTLIRNERNLGFAGAVNVGLRAARGDVLILFNQDAVAESGWLGELVTGLMASRDIGIAGCKIYYEDGKTISHAGVVLTDERMLPVHRGEDEADRGQYDSPADVNAVTGAAMAIRREVLNAIGLFDEDYFLYFEDTSFCLRAREAGFRVVYVPQAVARHRVAASLGPGSIKTLRYYHVSRLLFLLKHFDAQWFANQFLAGEVARLNGGLLHSEYRLIREVYLTTMSGLIENVRPYEFAQQRFDADQRDMIVDALSRLAEAVIEAVQNEPGECFWLRNEETRNWWQVREPPFTSSVPVLGPLFARFREAWLNVAARWYIRGLLVQQLEINRRLVFAAEMNNRLIQDLNRDVVSLYRSIARLRAEHDPQDQEVP